MTDNEADMPHGDERAAPARKPAATSTARTKQPVRSHRLLTGVGVMLGVVAGLSWGAWVTKGIVDKAHLQNHFVKLQLQGVITEYLQAQARSGTDDRTAAAQTTQFMAELDKAVAEVGKSGRIVLVNEAVIGGDIPDITPQVKKAVYAKVAMPKVVAATPVIQDMQAYLASGTAPAGSGGPLAAAVPAGSPLMADGGPGGIAQ